MPTTQTFIQNVIDQFSELPQVAVIYVHDLKTKVHFWIFTTNNEYDDALMNVLLTIEEDLMETHRGLTFYIRYISFALCNTPGIIVTPGSKKVLDRRVKKQKGKKPAPLKSS